MLAGVHVEHELCDGAVQPRQPPLEQHKARAGNLGRGLKIKQALSLAKLDMVLGCKTESADRAHTARLRVIFRRPAHRNTRMGQIGNH